MFHQFKKINNESGIVLFIVLMTAIIIMVLSLGILTQSMNEVNYAQQQIDQIVTQQWSKGMFWNAESTGSFGNTGISNIKIQGRSYNVMLNSTGVTNQYIMTTNYEDIK